MLTYYVPLIFVVPIFAHEQGHLDAHPVLVGHSGYTQVTISGEPNSIGKTISSKINLTQVAPSIIGIKGPLILLC